MKKAIIIFCIVMIAVVVLAQALGDRDVFAELFPRTATDELVIDHASDISTDTFSADIADVKYLYIGEDEDYVQVYNIEISEDGKSLIIYKVDSEPIIFGGTINE